MGTIRSDRKALTVARANSAQGERLIEETRQFGYRRKHGERMAHSRNQLPDLDVTNEEI